MDTVSFLRKILPSQGVYVVAVQRKNRKGFSHVERATLEDMASFIRWMETKEPDSQVFHACASFKERRTAPSKTDPTKTRSATRCASNVAFTRSQWVDVDVGEGKDYPTIRAAVEALAAALKALSLPAPMIVKSGRGLHCYWPFTKDIDARQAHVISQSLQGAFKAVGFKHDTSRTADLASLLRPVGSHWRKEGPDNQIEVKLLRDAPCVSPRAFAKAVLKYRPTEPQRVIDNGPSDEWGTGPKNYPPSSAHQIVKFCPAMSYVASERGNVAEPLWRAMLGLVKYTAEGDALAHEWSKGYEGYDPAETQAKMDNWKGGPTRCASFGAVFEGCRGCEHARKNSPIHLGYTEANPPAAQEHKPAPAAPSAPPAVDAPIYGANEFFGRMPADIPFWPKNYAWDGTHLCAKVKDENGVVSWAPFCTSLMYPFHRYESAENASMTLNMCTMVREGVWKQFEVESVALADTQSTLRELAKYEVFPAHVKQGRDMTRQFLQDFVQSMKVHAIETKRYSSLGWHGDGFVLGGHRVTERGMEPVLTSPDLAQTSDFTAKGTAAEWAARVNEIYNRPGAEPYQFIIAAAFASPLVALAGSDLWHGIPIALTGPSGLGKTTTCQVAVSMYGPPGSLTGTANEQGSTMNALLKRQAMVRHLPYIMDEMTGRDTKDIADMLYALSNGRPKNRLRQDGSLITSDLQWDNISYITGNMNITAMLADQDRHRAEATQLRCFEIHLPDEFNSKVFQGVNAKAMIDELLHTQCGMVGREYLRYIVKNKGKVSEALHNARQKHNPVCSTTTRERFYYDLVITVMAGAKIAKALGFIDFDLANLQKWALNHILILRGARGAVSMTIDDYVQKLLSDMTNRTVVTKYYRDGRTAKITEFVDTTRLRSPAARLATEDHRYFITVSSFNGWCQENNVPADWLRNALVTTKYVFSRAGSGGPANIFRNTNVAGTPSRYLEFDYFKISSTGENPLKVVQNSGDSDKVASG